MNIAQPSLSQFLQQFEAQLGCQLFLRTTRGVVPTVAGKAFIDDAVIIQRLYRETQIRLRDINDVKGGCVRLGIVAFPLHKLRKDENIEILLNDEVVIAAKKGHPIHRYLHTGEDGRIWVNFRDAARFEFVLGPVDTRLGRIARQQFHACKKTPITRNDNLSASLALSMARRGLALALTYSSAMSTRNVDFISIGEEGIYLPLALAYPPSSYRSKAVIELAKVIHEVLEED